MKPSTIVLSVSCLINTLCVGMPIFNPAEGENPSTNNGLGIPKPNTRLSFNFKGQTKTHAPTVKGPIPKVIELPDADTGTAQYVLFKVRLSPNDKSRQDTFCWALLALKYTYNSRQWEAALGAPTYLAHLVTLDGEWKMESHQFNEGWYVTDVAKKTQRYLPLAYVSEAGVLGLFGEMEKVPVDNLMPGDEDWGNLQWFDGVLEYFKSKRRLSPRSEGSGETPVVFPTVRYSLTGNGPLPEVIDLPAANTQTAQYVLFKALLPSTNEESPDIHSWVLLALRYSFSSGQWKAVEGAPTYLSHLVIRNGKWEVESRDFIEDRYVTKMAKKAERHMALAYVPEAAVPSMFSEMKNARIDDLPVDDEDWSKLLWINRVAEHFKYKPRLFPPL
ncbi:MAG: hypothetical protein M1829_002886 [Trizodia sp. TS-e1964]|nr:MAG: hypothetical protein M1829_002886 [Trizodia sp. TS-e1964]